MDIEGRTRAEEELRKSARELQRSEFYPAEVQRLGHIGSWVFDPAGGSTTGRVRYFIYTVLIGHTSTQL